MKQLWLCFVTLGVIFGLAVPSHAHALISDSPSLIITEIKVKNDTSANGYNEFIELYNADVTSLNLNDFTIEYFNSPAPASSDQPIKKVVVADGLLLPTQTIALAANKQQIPGALDSPFSSLSDSGGLVRIRSLDDTVQDQIAWTSTSSIAIAPVLFLSSNTSNKTKSFTRSLDNQGNPVLANPSWSLVTPTPRADALLPVSQPNPDPETDQTVQQPDQQSAAQNDTTVPENQDIAASVLPLRITELLPNPAPPASDSTDEYIELYNPNDDAVDLSGYRLQSGNTYSYSYTFTSGTLASHEYRAFYVSETSDLLANSGGRARLLDADGQVISETIPYDMANDGLAWAFISGSWQWTTLPTPNAANVLTLPEAKADKSTTTTSKPKTTAKSSTAKAVAAKTTAKPKTTKASTTADTSSGDSAAVPASIHPLVIAGVGLIAVGYAAYEYRSDFSNRLYQLRRYRTTRRAARAKA